MRGRAITCLEEAGGGSITLGIIVNLLYGKTRLPVGPLECDVQRSSGVPTCVRLLITSIVFCGQTVASKTVCSVACDLAWDC